MTARLVTTNGDFDTMAKEKVTGETLLKVSALIYGEGKTQTQYAREWGVHRETFYGWVEAGAPADIVLGRAAIRALELRNIAAELQTIAITG